MKKTHRKETLFARWKNDIAGSIAAMWITSSVAIIITAGSAYDATIAFTAKAKAQSIADAVALNAAIYVKEFGEPPQNDIQGFVGGTSYNVSDTSHDLSKYVSSTNDVNNSWVRVTYDEETGQATAVVSGITAPRFMSIVNITSIDFSARSTVNYAIEDLNNSVSVAMVLDVSGSMFFHDETGVKRQDAMESAVIDLMHNFNALVADQEDDGQILRTGMIPYYSRIWFPAVINMNWGTISDNNIFRLFEGGGTNSSGAMNLARNWMNGETAFHEAETGRENPKKYVIFMTDGVNNRTFFDTSTINACNAMKAEGVEIFTIGYALTLQTYGSPAPGVSHTPTQAVIDRATALLSNCASSPEHFRTTSGDTSISEIFENIGADIAADIIRISN